MLVGVLVGVLVGMLVGMLAEGWVSGSTGAIWHEGGRWLPGEAALRYISTILCKGSVRVRRYKWRNSVETETLTQENPVQESYSSS